MEKEGLIRSMKKLEENSLNIAIIVTDRHPQIQKWVRENLKQVTHYYDPWHICKGMHYI